MGSERKIVVCLGFFFRELLWVAGSFCRLHVQYLEYGLQTGGEVQTEGKMQNADCRPFKYISCYFHYRVLTVNRVIPPYMSNTTLGYSG